MIFEGVLPVNKPSGLTSHDVVSRVRRIIGMKRIGHTGTLDPQVTGVLPLCIGRATRIVEYIQDLPKEYKATLRFGLSTDTQDLSGNVVQSVDIVHITEEQIHETIARFLGEIEQVPPMYSAVKVQGKRLYELARQGVEIERKPRKVNIYRIEIENLRLDVPHPEMTFTVLCSKGTYIRTLCSDIGLTLGYPAVMVDLLRTSTGQFTLDDCLTLPQIERYYAEGSLSRYLIPADRAIPHIPERTISDEWVEQVLQGRKVSIDDLAEGSDIVDIPNSGLIRLYSVEQKFLGIFEFEDRYVRPVKVFS